MKLFLINKKGFFISLFLLLFISVFLLCVLSYPPVSLKENIFLNICSIIKFSMTINIDSPIILKQNINNSLFSYLVSEDNAFFYIRDLSTNTLSKISLDDLQSISTVIVYRPTPDIITKRYILHNGISKNKQLIFQIKTNNYISEFVFPQDFEIRVNVYV
jgi:hypothetical protein